jgi:hypothetical protein
MKMNFKLSSGITICSIVLAACGASGLTSKLSPVQEIPTVTSATSYPTSIPTFTEFPTETFTPTVKPTPVGGVSAEAILERATRKLEVESNLNGKAIVEGEVVELNFTNLSSDIIFAIDPTLANRGRDTGLLPYDTVYLNPGFNSATGGVDPKRQIATDLWYLHYKAWQYDQDNKFYKENRENVSFVGYLKMVSSGGDGSHLFWVSTQFDKIYPDREVKIDPRKTQVLFNFIGSPLGLTPIKYDLTKDVLIVQPVIYPYKKDTNPNSSNTKAGPYGSFSGYLSFMSASSEVQRYYNVGSYPEQTDRLSDITRAILLTSWNFYTYPLLGHSFGFK